MISIHVLGLFMQNKIDSSSLLCEITCKQYTIAMFINLTFFMLFIEVVQLR